MIVESISAISEIAESGNFLPVAQPDASAGTFGSWFTKELDSVNSRLINTENDVQKLAVGEVQNLHEVMINMEEARLSFQLLVQVRNRVLEAYQEVMRMQV